ncbi:MAG: phosphopantetheine-binding protein [Oscillospiraceae bacterium]|nr:phosphopantetheine-binding protein [Oscillospiraceae bacterium]
MEPVDVKSESYFSQDLGFNSYDFICMLSGVEDEFGVKIPETELANLFTVKDLMDYIEKQK